jgi:KDO2-lipid IV(A) lauroyltransferase
MSARSSCFIQGGITDSLTAQAEPPLETTTRSTTDATSARLWRRFAAPRHWPVWLGFNTMKLVAALPYAWQAALGRAAGRLFGLLARYRGHIAAVNLGLCFPELSDAERRQLLRDHFAALGVGAFETALAWWGTNEQIRPLGEVNGIEHLDAALARGRGVILLTAHFVHLELGARFITLHRPFHAMYRPHRNPLFDAIMRRERERRSRLPPIDRVDIRSLLRGLKQGHAVWYAPDQNYGPRNSVLAPFFGVPALTVTATSRLARMTGAAVVPYLPERLPDNGGFRVTVLPALDNFPSDDAAADALRINRLIEDWVRRAPEQYLWVHRRFKKGPPELRDIYRRNRKRTKRR